MNLLKMKIIFSLMLVAIIGIAQVKCEKESSLQAEWGNFIKLYNKVYSSVEEESKRRSIWEKNLEFINKHNAEADQGKHTFRVGMNKFGDQTAEEFKAKLTYVSKQRSLGQRQTFSVSIPDSVDWRKQGCVEGVREQGQCNDLYAFGASESLGGILCAKIGKMTPLSAQQIIDCSRNWGNMGCEGGYITQSFLYIQAAPGLDSKASYPDGGDETCKYNKDNVVCSDNGYISIVSGNETALTIALATVGPVAAAIDAGQSSFQFYQSGIYYDPACNPESLDHLILLVGYGTLAGQDYYIGKNSWGVEWGMNGYVNMARNKNNSCGIASDVNYPILS